MTNTPVTQPDGAPVAPPAPAAPAPSDGLVSLLLGKLSLRDGLIVMGVIGLLGTGAGAGGANLFAPDNATLEKQQAQITEMSKAVKTQGEQITALVAAHQLHLASEGHPRTLDRIVKLEEQLGAQLEQDRRDWKQLVQTLARVESRLSTIEVQLGRLDP